MINMYLQLGTLFGYINTESGYRVTTVYSFPPESIVN